MRFNRKDNWKCVQLKDWTKVCVHNMVTSDLTKRWAENVSKYMIELKPVHLTIVIWDLTERWTENVSKYMIELKSVHLTTVTWDLIERWTENVSK